jgi:hypothetical protein
MRNTILLRMLLTEVTQTGWVDKLSLVMQTNLDLYTDYLLSSFGQTSATNMARLMDDQLSHDDVTRFLSQPHQIGQTLWKTVKPLVRKHQTEQGLLLVDDSLAHKPHSQENGLVSTYFDHTSHEYVKAINFLTLLYRAGDTLLPVGLHLVIKYLQCQIKDRKEVWKAALTKNEAFRALLYQAHQNAIPFGYVLADSCGSPPGYTNADNINAVLALKKHWFGAFKTNLEVALSKQDRANGRFVSISTVALAVGVPREVYIRSVAVPVLVCKDILPNKDGSVGELLLLTTDTTMSYQQILTTYQKRWGIEDYHKSLKNNTSLQNSPARNVTNQSTHLLASVCAFVKLERLRLTECTNQFALKGRLYIKAIQAALAELRLLQQNNLLSNMLTA